MTAGTTPPEARITAVVQALFKGLAARGVREFCVCAGARNAAIVEVLARSPQFTVRHFFEERSAAFFALGRVMTTRQPVAVLTTSGTAAAELFPAMVEAYYQHLPLIAVTADRPGAYAGSGAPQAIEQRGIFGIYAGETHDLEWLPGQGVTDLAAGKSGGPAHWNVRLEEGLTVSFEMAETLPATALPSWEASANDAEGAARFWEDMSPLLVLAGGIHPVDVPETAAFLAELGAPVIAEATANLHGEAALEGLLIHGGEKALQEMPARRVLRLGAVPSWRWWRNLEARPDISVLNLTQAPFRGLARQEHVMTMPWSAVREPVAGRASPVGSGHESCVVRRDRLLDALPLSEPAWMRRLSQVIGAGASVFLGNSLPVREWNLAALPARPGTAFFASRGANGIDGLVSTWLGVSAEAEESWLIVGDLSALYDLAAPWVLPQLRQGKRRIVVIQNGGGKIFSSVAWLSELDAAARKVMENSNALSFEPWAQLWGLSYRRFEDARDLVDDEAPSAIWEIRPDAGETAAFWKEWSRG